MKKDVKSWEFWVLVGVVVLLLYGMYQVFSAAASVAQGASNLVGNVANAPGQAALGVANAGENFLSFLWTSIFGASNSDQTSQDSGASDSGSN